MKLPFLRVFKKKNKKLDNEQEKLIKLGEEQIRIMIKKGLSIPVGLL